MEQWIEIAIASTLTAAIALAWVGAWSRSPRRLRTGEQGFERDAFPMFKNRPTTRASVASFVGAAVATVPQATVVRVDSKAGTVAVEAVVPWTAASPGRRRELQEELAGVLEQIRPVGVVVQARVPYR